MPALLRRLGAAVALLWLVVSLTFVLVRAAPGDPAALLLPPTADAADAARLRTSLGLDRPLAVQYARWLGATLRGDLGTSFAQGRPVATVLAEALPPSLALGAARTSTNVSETTSQSSARAAPRRRSRAGTER